MVEERLTIAAELWTKNIRAEFIHPLKTDKELEDLFMHCKTAGISWMVILRVRSIQFYFVNAVPKRHLHCAG